MATVNSCKDSQIDRKKADGDDGCNDGYDNSQDGDVVWLDEAEAILADVEGPEALAEVRAIAAQWRGKP